MSIEPAPDEVSGTAARTWEALERSEARYRALAEATSQAVWAWDPETGEGDFGALQRWWQELTGQTPEEQGGSGQTGWLERVHPEDRERTREAFVGALAAGTPYDIEYRILTLSGEIRYLAARAAAVRDSAGRIREWVGTLADITERRRAEEALRESAERLSLALAAAQLGDWSWEAATDVITLSPQAAEIFALPPGPSITWARLRQVLDEKDQERARRAVEQAIAEHSDYDIEYRVLQPDGARLWVSAKGRAQYDPEGRVLGMRGVVQDVTARKQAEEQLREADRRKDEFLAVLSHELRNPLAPIRNSLELLREIGPRDPQMEQARAMIQRQVGHLTRLVDDLLDVSRISRGKILLHTERLDLVPLVRVAVEDHRQLLARSGLTLTADLPDQPVWLSGDPTRLAQVVGNLLQNANKFTNRGGRVTVRLERAAGEAVLTVEDTGIGMEPEILDRLFQPFSQADRSLARSRGGLGLGLSLVRGLVELHGGSVEAASEGEGRGSRFTVHLPLEPEAP